MTIALLAPSDRRATIGAWRDDGPRPSGVDRLSEGIGIVGFVADHVFGWHTPQQGRGLSHVVHRSGGQTPLNEVAECIDQHVDLGRQPASGAPERLRAVFLGAPAACWWARTMVESMNTSRNRRSLAKAANTRCHTPARDQRANRWYTLFQFPNCGGRSRHGLPVRAIHSTASTNSRLSAPVRPRSPSLPGKNASMRFHCSSRSCFRIAPPTSSEGWGDMIKLIVNRL